MGRNKFSASELKKISGLLAMKNKVNRAKQKLIRHDLRVEFEFNIADFNEPGKAFGAEELRAAVERGAIQVLDEATIEAMKAKRARDKVRDEALKEQQAVESGEAIDWRKELEAWQEWEQGLQK